MNAALRLLRVLFLALALAPASALAEGPVDAAFRDAIAAFAAARPHLGAVADGVDIAAYGDALGGRRFVSAYWGGVVEMAVEERLEATGSCNRFAAFVRMPPENGVVSLVLCPEFSTPGADSLRRLTILHELVHVVAGPDECRAMSFAARIERLAFGHATPVERYWRANGCERSGLRAP